MTTQLPTWHGDPLPPSGSTASSSSRHSQDAGSDKTTIDLPASRASGDRPANHAARASGDRPANHAARASDDRPANHASERASDDRLHGRTELRPELSPDRRAAAELSGELRGAAGIMIGSRYALRTAIGHGGMGTVWRATDTLLRRDVAVKEVLLPAGMAASDRDAMYQRTLREARAAAALSHPAVVQVYDVVTDGGRPWIVMELLQARSLAEIIVEDGPLAPRAVAKIGIALLGALEMAHAAGVLHRDVKPANVLICNDGRCVLTDFGVARMPSDSQLTTPGMVLGSPHFISPERAIGAPFGPPSDLFSLGVTLYTAVEGRPPFDKPDPIETMRAVVEEQPVPSLRAGALDGVLTGLLEKDPARRWDVPRARAVLRELLAGALASNAPSHHTDPYAVVRPAPYTPPVAPASTSGQIGGRAMLAPGESVSGAIRRRQAVTPRPPAQRSPVEPEATNPGLPLAETGAFTPPDAPAATPSRPDPATTTAFAPRTDPTESTTAFVPPAPVGNVYGGRAGSRPAAGAGSPAARGTALLAGASAGLRQVSGKAAEKYRELPPKGRMAVVAGAVVGVLVLGIVVGTTLFGGSPESRQTTEATVDPNKPLFADVQTYTEKGITVNVPKSWTPSRTGSYIDYTDPADNGRRARVNVENAGTQDAHQVAVTAGRGLEKNPSRCKAYQEVGLRDVQAGGHPAAELEYTCGEGTDMRHGIWRFVVAGGKSYNFFVSVPESRFAASKIIYDEMVRSFRLSA
ncbi:protein kinase domain-containing protein [Planosporangium sp. 12N6]|uniref:serine/threonine-protein kinase n=1 Tax=Planosporangium spinosum TaxID=3402278 RepID=UPI003CEC29E4